ncbi:MAG: hypothetical protein ACC630_05535 [Nitrospinota bacterium]
MRSLKVAIILSCIVHTSLTGLPMGVALANEVKQPQGVNERLLNRIDFGNAYIMGQTIKSGAVYLLHRKKNKINSMLKYRENYREEILEDFSIQDMKIKNEP